MGGAERASREQVLKAAEALKEVGKRAWLFLSAPVVEGITPLPLRDAKASEPWETDEFLPRRHGYFRLEEAGLSCLDHVALYGDACFEGILIPKGQIFLYKEHLWRLWRSAHSLGIHIPYSQEELAWRVLETSRRVGYGADEAGYIRLVITRGMGDLGINPLKCVGATVFSLSSTIRLYPSELYDQGIEVGVARGIRRPDEQVLDPTVKSNNYLNNVMALREGTHGGQLMECLVLTRHGFLAEATVDNIFLVLREPGWEKDPARVTVQTPRGAYCLNGITRALIMNLARQKGYRVDDAADLLTMDVIGPDRECFMTGTGAGVMPIIAVAGHQVGDGKPGPITRGLVAGVRGAMADPAFGLNLKATRQEVRDYLKSPSLLGSLAPVAEAAV